MKNKKNQIDTYEGLHPAEVVFKNVLKLPKCRKDDKIFKN